jgi:hypothetical protein
MQVLLPNPAPHSLPGLLCDLELNGPARLPLHDRRSGPHPPIEGHIIDPERDQVTGRSLLSRAKLNEAKSRTRRASWSLTRMDQISLASALSFGRVGRRSCLAVLLKQSPTVNLGRYADETQTGHSSESLRQLIKVSRTSRFMHRYTARDPELTLDVFYHPIYISETSITYCFPNRIASTTRPSALVPVPSPKL